MYRPEGWKNPYSKTTCMECYDESGAFEAGADAMLEGLKSDGTHFPKGFSTAHLMKKGYLVFIPEEG